MQQAHKVKPSKKHNSPSDHSRKIATTQANLYRELNNPPGAHRSTVEA
jgi:hypothetical protein